MKLSIVASLYNSAPYLEEFCDRCTVAAKRFAGDDYEIVLVNDGSPDDGLTVGIELTELDAHIKLVDLSRNFGHHRAMMIGLEHSKGDHIFLIDCDLEEQPEWLDDFSENLNENKCDVVYGVQEKRKGNFLERYSGVLYYRILNLWTGLNIHPNIVTARLMTRRYVNALLAHREREIMIAGLWQITGFDQRPMPVAKLSTSPTNYSLTRKIAIFADAITSFSNTPLRAIFYIGLIIFALSFLYTGYLVINRLVFSAPLSGWTSVMASIWLLGGLIILFIGVVGSYLSKIFIEVKQRPYAIVREVHEQQR